MKNELVHQIKNEIYVDSKTIADKLEVPHKVLLRTIERIVSHGLEDEVSEFYFTNKMNRKYKAYYVTERLSNIIDSIYIFTGYGEGSNNNIIKNTEPETTYIMTNNEGLFKIGCTSNLKTRLSAIQVGNHKFIEVYATIKGGKNIESELHEIFKEKRVSGEWFNIKEFDIHRIYDQYKTKFNYISTLGGELSEIELNSNGSEHYIISEFIKNVPFNKLRKLTKTIESLNNNGKYSIAKDEVNRLADNLCFRPVISNN